MKITTFRDIDGERVGINPDRVRFIRAAGADMTDIHFGQLDTGNEGTLVASPLRVHDCFDIVLSKLRGA